MSYTEISAGNVDISNGRNEVKRKIIFKRNIQLKQDSLYGNGLGFATVKNIADAHNVQVWVEPNYPTGNSFCLKLPVVW
jgi:light-regulated signal transduction histidine kinase (bacteriophytochrome)